MHPTHRADRRVRGRTPRPLISRRPGTAATLAAATLAAGMAAGLSGCRGGDVRPTVNPLASIRRMVPGLRVEPDRPYTPGPPAPADAPPPPDPVPAGPRPVRGPSRGDDATRPAPYEPSGTARPVPSRPVPAPRPSNSTPPARVPAPAPPADGDAYYKVGSGYNPLAWAAAFGRKLGVVAEGPSRTPTRLVAHRRPARTPAGTPRVVIAAVRRPTVAARPTVSVRPAVRLGVPEFGAAPVVAATPEPLAVDSPFTPADRRGRPVAHSVPVRGDAAANPFAATADAPPANPFADATPALMAPGFGG